MYKNEVENQQNGQLLPILASHVLWILPQIEAKTIKYRGENKFGKQKSTKHLTEHLADCVFSVCWVSFAL